MYIKYEGCLSISGVGRRRMKEEEIIQLLQKSGAVNVRNEYLTEIAGEITVSDPTTHSHFTPIL